MSHQILTAAIDFGTSFSTWACSFRHEYMRDKVKVHIKNWKSIGNNISQKGISYHIIVLFEFSKLFTYIRNKRHIVLNIETMIPPKAVSVCMVVRKKMLQGKKTYSFIIFHNSKYVM